MSRPTSKSPRYGVSLGEPPGARFTARQATCFDKRIFRGPLVRSHQKTFVAIDTSQASSTLVSASTTITGESMRSTTRRISLLALALGSRTALLRTFNFDFRPRSHPLFGIWIRVGCEHHRRDTPGARHRHPLPVGHLVEVVYRARSRSLKRSVTWWVQRRGRRRGRAACQETSRNWGAVP